MSLAYFTSKHRYWASWNRRTRRISSVLQDTVSAGPGLGLGLGPPPSRAPRPRLPLPGEHGPEDHLRAERWGQNSSQREAPAPPSAGAAP